MPIWEAGVIRRKAAEVARQPAGVRMGDLSADGSCNLTEVSVAHEAG
jgi:hypothetical protein